MPWAFKIPFGRPKRIGQGFVDFKKYVTAIINEKRQQQQLARQNKQQLQKADSETSPEGAEARTGESKETDLLALLCSAQDSDSKITLTDNEIFSDAFIFLLAGHEV
jgi:cytochrome P450